MKEMVVYYVDFETEQIWKTFPEFTTATATYKNFKDAILIHYPDATGDYVYSIRDMDMLTGERQRLGIQSTKDLSEFHLHFLAITTWLIEKKQLGDLEQRRAYIRTFRNPLAASINNRLQMKFTNQHPNIPHDVKDVYEAARYVLQSSAISAQQTAPSGVPPVAILQRPSPTVVAQEPVVKTENIGALFAEFSKTIIDAMNNSMRGPSSNPRERQVNCNMCDGPHYIRDCPRVVEYTTAGKCRRNSDGKVVLPSGIYVPRDIPGTLLSERIDEWHRRFPNQLSTATLLHTVAGEILKSPAIAAAATHYTASYTLSTGDRIATLEAELFNLRARKPMVVTPGIIRTRAQRGRETSPAGHIEEIRSNPVVRHATPEEVALPAPQIVTAAAPIEEITEEREHPFHKAKDAAYIPPVDRNVGAPVKTPAYKKPEGAYKTLPPVHDPAIAEEVFNRAMGTQVLVTQRELLSLSPEVRSKYRDATTTRRIPNPAGAPQHNFLVEVDDDEDIRNLSTFAFQAANDVAPPAGAYIVPDPIEAYYASLPKGQEPDLDRLTVASESSSIRSIHALVMNNKKIECTVDPGCQIIAMAETECHSLGLSYDPNIRLNMESANGTFDWSRGLARNVPFQISKITLYFQVHVIRSPSYAVLLGRPFDVLTESVIRNYANEDQTITITDPNSGRMSTIPTFPRGTFSSKTLDRQDFA